MTNVTERKCPECVSLNNEMKRAIRSYDRSAETDARVLLRRHMRVAHKKELPYPW